MIINRRHKTQNFLSGRAKDLPAPL